ncbi:restriction endonuclease [Phyllobacterium chamaecytisi]|uniref:restriction endonuclease n=1 Tax=Phyllobacterium chamaecytisi TaxID=2876082 RepID=UPI001CC90469|nr:restriction endonuclease [Phyllobacterium sp. KW56]MBZ9600490.1 restriction endonuclease [Phyllobacterium sp. KW56]
MTASSVALEQLVAKIQADLAPNSDVVHNVMLNGRHSGRKRQIDVLVRDKIGQYEILIVIDCKDYNKPVDVKGVEEFAGLVDDVAAQRGVLVCPKGFSEAAKKRAQTLQIDLYSPIDTDPHKWTARVTVPALCDFRSASMSFRIKVSSTLPWRLPEKFYEDLDVFDENDAPLQSPLDAALDKWNEGKFPIDIGVHQDIEIYDGIVKADSGYDTTFPVNLTVSLRVTRKLYFGQYPIKKFSGFKDEVKGEIIANAFTLGALDPEFVEKQWKVIADESDAPVKHVITFMGLVGWATDK